MKKLLLIVCTIFALATGHVLAVGQTALSVDTSTGAILYPTGFLSANNLVIGTNLEAWSSNLDTWATRTPFAGSLTITTGKTANFTNTLTLSGTDGSTLNIGSGGTLGTNAFNSTAFVPPTTTVNGHALSSNVTVTSTDVGLGTTSTPQFAGIGVGNISGTGGIIVSSAVGSGTGRPDAKLEVQDAVKPLLSFFMTTNPGNNYSNSYEGGDVCYGYDSAGAIHKVASWNASWVDATAGTGYGQFGINPSMTGGTADSVCATFTGNGIMFFNGWAGTGSAPTSGPGAGIFYCKSTSAVFGSGTWQTPGREIEVLGATNAIASLRRNANSNNGVLELATGSTLDWEIGENGGSNSDFSIYSQGTSSQIMTIARATGVMTYLAEEDLTFSGTTMHGLELKDSTDTSGVNFEVFRNSSAGPCGSISRVTTTNAVAYNTSSDERLKTPLRPWSLGRQFDTLPIGEFNWKNNGVVSHGTLAQELYKIYPDAVTVGGDDANKNPWQVDYGKLSVPLIARVQEIDHEIDSLPSTIEIRLFEALAIASFLLGIRANLRKK